MYQGSEGCIMGVKDLSRAVKDVSREQDVLRQ